MLEIHFTVKQEIKEDKTQIKMLDIQSADDNGKLIAPDSQLELSIKKDNILNIIIIVILGFVLAEIVSFLISKKIGKRVKNEEDKENN